MLHSRDQLICTALHVCDVQYLFEPDILYDKNPDLLVNMKWFNARRCSEKTHLLLIHRLNTSLYDAPYSVGRNALDENGLQNHKHDKVLDDRIHQQGNKLCKVDL